MNDDTFSLLAWARDEELKAHNKNCVGCESVCSALIFRVCLLSVEERAFRKVINHIENNPKELHRCLIPAG